MFPVVESKIIYSNAETLHSWGLRDNSMLCCLICILHHSQGNTFILKALVNSQIIYIFTQDTFNAVK